MVRMSLRMKFVLLSFACVLAARWGWAVRRDRAEEAAVAYFVHFGGDADIVEEHRWSWIPGARRCAAIYLDGLSLQRELRARFESAVEQIDWSVVRDLRGLQVAKFSGLELDDADLIYLAELSELESLNLSANRLTDAGLPALRGLRKLKSLCLSRNAISGCGLGFLADLPNLEDLTAEECSLNDEFLAHAAGCTRLQFLYAWSDGLTDEGLTAVRKLENLRTICLGGSFSPSAMQHLAESLFDRNLEACSLHSPQGDLVLPRGVVVR